eukprot:17661-Heterococcus_DN1.PRE.1
MAMLLYRAKAAAAEAEVLRLHSEAAQIERGTWCWFQVQYIAQLVMEANLVVQRELSELRIASARAKYNTAPPAVQELLEQLAEQKRITKAE